MDEIISIEDALCDGMTEAPTAPVLSRLDALCAQYDDISTERRETLRIAIAAVQS